MEFFEFADIRTNADGLAQALTMESLPLFCSSIYSLLPGASQNQGDISCLWGRHRVHRDIIKGGVRFSLAECQNALAWTITTGFPPFPEKVVIHCTINRPQQDPSLVESIKDFVGNWKRGLEEKLPGGEVCPSPDLIPIGQLLGPG